MVTTLQADPLLAVLALLAADPDVAELTEGRIYAPELLEAAVADMPQGCIVLHRAGGTGSRSYLAVRHQRLDIKCYGSTPYQSTRVYLALAGCLKRLDRALVDQVLLHWAHEESGPFDLREPEVDWPLTFSTWELMAGEIVAA